MVTHIMGTLIKMNRIEQNMSQILIQVYSQMNADQRCLYNLYKAIDLLQLTGDYEGAMRYLEEELIVKYYKENRKYKEAMMLLEKKISNTKVLLRPFFDVEIHL